MTSRPQAKIGNALGSRPIRELTIRRAFTKRVVLALLSVIVALVVALTMLWHPESNDERFSLSQVQDGLKCTILRGLGSWEHSSVEIDDGTARVAWNLGDPSLCRGVWTAAEFEIQQLGNMAVRLVVVDLEGDGNMSHNDYVVVTTVNSTGFMPNVLYKFTLGHGFRAISGVFVEQSFRFEDGKLVTGEQKTTVIPI